MLHTGALSGIQTCSRPQAVFGFMISSTLLLAQVQESSNQPNTALLHAYSGNKFHRNPIVHFFVVQGLNSNGMSDVTRANSKNPLADYSIVWVYLDSGSSDANNSKDRIHGHTWSSYKYSVHLNHAGDYANCRPPPNKGLSAKPRLHQAPSRNNCVRPPQGVDSDWLQWMPLLPTRADRTASPTRKPSQTGELAIPFPVCSKRASGLSANPFTP